MGRRLHSASATARRAGGLLTEEFFDRPAVALWSGAALVAVVVLIGLLLPAGPLSIDRRWSEWMHDTQIHALHQLALVFNWLGRGIGRALSLAAIGVALAVARRWWALAAFAAAESLTPLASNLTKHLVGRPRPDQELLHVTGSSFPSGHAAYAGATCVALVLLYARSSRHRAHLVGSGGTRDRRDGLEPHVPRGALADRRDRRRAAGRRRRAAQLRGRAADRTPLAGLAQKARPRQACLGQTRFRTNNRLNRATASPPVAGIPTIGARGFEPPTARPPAGCATRLRHAPRAPSIPGTGPASGLS